MAAVPGYEKDLQIKVSGSYVSAPANTATLTANGEILDATVFGATGYRTRINGLRDWSVTATLVYDATDTTVAQIVTAWTTGVTVDMQYLHDGTNGFQGLGVVESLSFQGGVGDLETMNISLQAAGALTAVP